MNEELERIFEFYANIYKNSASEKYPILVINQSQEYYYELKILIEDLVVARTAGRSINNAIAQMHSRILITCRELIEKQCENVLEK